MGIFNNRSKRALVGAMRECVCDTLMESATLTSKQATDKMNFVFENATYEQLLNITMNPNRDTNYLPAYVLEGAVALLHRACLTKRKNIGPNAITEAARLLQKETGAVITESMKTAALDSVNNGNGLKVVKKLIEEAVLLQEEITAGGIQQLMDVVSGSSAATRPQKTAFRNIATAFANRNTGSFDVLRVNTALNTLGIPVANRQNIINALQTGDSAVLGNLCNVAKDGGFTNRLNLLQGRHASIASTFGAGSAEAVKRSDAINRNISLLRNIGKNPALPKPPGGPAINPNIFSNANREIATQSKRMNPWAAAGLGLAAAGAGALLYNRYKQNQQMQQ